MKQIAEVVVEVNAAGRGLAVVAAASSHGALGRPAGAHQAKRRARRDRSVGTSRASRAGRCLCGCARKASSRAPGAGLPLPAPSARPSRRLQGHRQCYIPIARASLPTAITVLIKPHRGRQKARALPFADVPSRGCGRSQRHVPFGRSAAHSRRSRPGVRLVNAEAAVTRCWAVALCHC